MTPPIRNIDHLLICARDLDACEKHFRRLGFTATPKGRHQNRDTGNYCIMFPNDYLELLGIVDREAPPSPHHDWMEKHGNGLMALALAPENDELVFDWFTEQGLHPEAQKLTRSITAEGELRDLEFRNVILPREETPAFSMFACHHVTPGSMRTESWLSHANGAVGLRGITVLVEDVDAAARQMQTVFGADALTWTDDIFSVRVGPHHALFADKANFDWIYPEMDEAFMGTGFGAITLITRDREATADYLDQSGLEFEESSDSILVLPTPDCPVIFEFVEAE